jgi:N-methylhydantoinase B
VQPGDQLVFETWGGGGWGDPLERPYDVIAYDLESGLVSADGLVRYGVVVSDDMSIDIAASDTLRETMREQRGEIQPFNFGGSLDELRASCLEETGFEPPKVPVQAPIAAAWLRKQKRAAEADSSAARAGD